MYERTMRVKTEKGRGMELTFSTIAMLIAIFAVLLVVLMFFQGGFREIGTGKFKTFADKSTPEHEVKIDDLIGNIGGWFGCVSNADCGTGYGCKVADKKCLKKCTENGDCASGVCTDSLCQPS